MFCWKGSWKIYFIYFATGYVKLKELNFIIGKVKPPKVVLEQGRRCLRRNELKRKTQFLFQIGSKCRKLANNVVHKVNTVFFSVKFGKFISLYFVAGWLYKLMKLYNIFFSLYLITTCKVAPGLKWLPEFCQDVLQ